MLQNIFDQTLKEALKKHGSGLKERLNDPITGKSFKERFLLALIRGSSTPKQRKREKKRLNAAMIEVFGHRIRRRPQANDDDDALINMAINFVLDRESGRKPRSIAKLARHASRLTTGNSPIAISKRLERKFCRQQEKLISRFSEADQAIEILQREAMAELETCLSRFGITFDADD